MRFSVLVQIVKRLSQFSQISRIERVSDNTLRIEFDKREFFYFDLSKGNSLIYKRKDRVIKRNYLAPFDVTLQKRFTNSKILEIKLLNGDKIIQIIVSTDLSYKKVETILQLEFTGRYTNAIILDKNIVIEALRHIDINTSYREVKPNKPLLALKKSVEFKIDDVVLENIDEYLYSIYEDKELKDLSNLKDIKINFLNKKIEKIDEILKNLPKKSELIEEAKSLFEKANILLSNMNDIKPYDKNFKGYNFDGEEVEIKIETNKRSLSEYINSLFNEHRRLKNRANSIDIEVSNLTQKRDYLLAFVNIIKMAKSKDEIELFFPKQSHKKVKKDEFETLFIDGFKILIGRNRLENAKLLKVAKSDDFWFHLKDYPSTHLIVISNKKELPINIVELSAKLCAEFSVKFSGNYLVDYTKRKFVRVESEANVTYNNYKTTSVDIIKGV